MRVSFSPSILTRVELRTGFSSTKTPTQAFFTRYSLGFAFFLCSQQPKPKGVNRWHITYTTYRDICLIKPLTKYIRHLHPFGIRSFGLLSFLSTPQHPLIANTVFRSSTPDLQTAGCSWLLTSNLYQPLFTIECFIETTARFTICEDHDWIDRTFECNGLINPPSRTLQPSPSTFPFVG